MAISEILASIDRDLAQLQQARALLNGGAARTAKKKAARPKNVTATPKKAALAIVTPAKPPSKKRKLSPEGRKRIVEALKKRWAAKKAASAK